MQWINTKIQQQLPEDIQILMHDEIQGLVNDLMQYAAVLYER